jgi:hypothetical protein
MRIFVGLTDVANITATYANGFKSLGHEVFSVVWNKSYFYPDSQYDLVIDERQPDSQRGDRAVSYLRMMRQMAHLSHALKCDLFIMFAPAVLPTQLYYPILKRIGKKIITAYWGSDIRYWYAFDQEMTYLGVRDEIVPFVEYVRSRSGGSYWDKLRTIRVAEKYSDLILSQPDCAQLQVRPYMRANLPLDLSKYKFNIPNRAKPVILHAPSIPEAKGTDVVLRVIQELRDEQLQFDFRLIEKMPNVELRNLLTDSDIVIDELYSATIGGLSAEAMATGNVVLVRYMADYCIVPPGCPAINVNQFALKDNLREIILDVHRRKELAQRGRPYVESANDHIKICQDLLTWLSNKENLDYHFHPTFFQQLKIPEQILEDEKEQAQRKRHEFFKTVLSTGTTRKR